jgi:hypothetical protein
MARGADPRGEYLGDVKAASMEAAEIEGARTFGLGDWQRKRVLLRKRL